MFRPCFEKYKANVNIRQITKTFIVSFNSFSADSYTQKDQRRQQLSLMDTCQHLQEACIFPPKSCPSYLDRCQPIIRSLHNLDH